jgi:hypothetical protein
MRSRHDAGRLSPLAIRLLTPCLPGHERRKQENRWLPEAGILCPELLKNKGRARSRCFGKEDEYS